MGVAMSTWTIREATPSDIPSLLKVIHAAFEEYRGRLDPPSGAHAETVDSLRRKLSTARVAIAEIEGKIVGCVFLKSEPGRVYISRLSVLPNERCRGIGSALMDFAEAWARREGLERAYLGVRIVLTEQQAYYTRRGYRGIGEARHEGFAEPTYLLMEKMLR
jgi:predicted N-acetyltransferase YhbS